MATGRKAVRASKIPVAVGQSNGWPAWADGQAVGRLREVLRSERVGHAYLLRGPRGVGKAELAQRFAQALCCTAIAEADRSQPCGVCRACKNAAKGAHPDVEVFSLETQAALAEKPGRGTHLTIETVRRLRGSAALLPLEATRRIIIVDDTETMQEPAQQALLKTLEEPPPAVTLLLLADEPELLLETVRSRCQHVLVRPVSESAVAEALNDLGVPGESAREIGALSRGCPAWAIAAVADGKVLRARQEEWESAVSWLASPQYERLVTAYRLGEQFSKRGSAVVGVVQAAVQILRGEMLATAQGTPGDGSEAPRDAAMATSLVFGQAVRASLQCLADLDANVRPRLALEAMVLTWPNLDLQPR